MYIVCQLSKMFIKIDNEETKSNNAKRMTLITHQNINKYMYLKRAH